MGDWYETYRYHSTEHRPYVQLLVGGVIRNTHSEVSLYHCEPPSTINRKTLANSGGYAAIGEAKAITNPLYTTLFVGFRNPELATAHVCLGRISYLMFRAKKEFRSSVGGDTDVVVIRNGRTEPQWVDIIDMRVAEGFGNNLNAALASTASVVVADNTASDAQDTLQLASKLSLWGRTYRNARFRVRGSRGLDGIDIS